ncbi:MAG: Sir2 family NAD-dependent protein deacetylase, partial [Bacteroidia bacterium]
GSGGLWEGYDIMKVASPQGWAEDYRMVLEFYNARRQNIANVKPNGAHLILKELEEDWDVSIVTQNIDNLHEQAGSTEVVHLHGEITKACCSVTKDYVEEIGFTDIRDGDLSLSGYQKRPFIVWFGENVPMITEAEQIVSKADVLLIIGTSLMVYPAAGLVNFVRSSVPIYVIDPNEVREKISVSNEVTHIKKGGSEGMIELQKILLENV